jgi:hypothetical protein
VILGNPSFQDSNQFGRDLQQSILSKHGTPSVLVCEVWKQAAMQWAEAKDITLLEYNPAAMIKGRQAAINRKKRIKDIADVIWVFTDDKDSNASSSSTSIITETSSDNNAMSIPLPIAITHTSYGLEYQYDPHTRDPDAYHEKMSKYKPCVEVTEETKQLVVTLKRIQKFIKTKGRWGFKYQKDVVEHHGQWVPVYLQISFGYSGSPCICGHQIPRFYIYCPRDADFNYTWTPEYTEAIEKGWCTPDATFKSRIEKLVQIEQFVEMLNEAH